MSRLQKFATITGLLLVVAGVAFIFWPAALIAAGAALLTAGLTDFEE